MAEFKGTIEDIRFRNEENGYTVATVVSGSTDITVVGVFPPVSEGSFVSVSGTFVTHPRFGRQLKADVVRLERPETTSGVTQFLGSGLIRGIGPKRAAAIVEKFGKDTLDVIEKDPKRLATVQGISPRIAKDIAESYGKVRAAADAMSFLMEYSVTSGLAMKIFNEYGESTIATVTSNPYRLIEDVHGVGFLTADRMASSLGISPRSDFRVRAGIFYALSENAEKNGNTLLPRTALADEAARLLGFDADDELIDKNIDALVMSRTLREVEYEGEPALMTAALFGAETRSAAKLCRMLESANRALPDCSDEIAEFERVEGVTFHSEQRTAIVSALANGVSVITGGPGTGKTTIVRCILRILTNHGMSVKLMAPTGRAAKRLSESTGADASTIHRALMTDDEESGGLNSDAVIVDEFSMVDVMLLSSLLEQLRDDAKLIIVGDADQLPSVGAGNALADIISCGEISVAKLTHIYRQDENGRIIVNAHKINAGEMPDLHNTGRDFFFLRSDSASQTADTVVGLVTERLPAFLNCDPLRIQVLCPMKSGDAGTVNLNRRLRAALLGTPTDELTVGENTFAAGDKVMHVVNNYNLVWTRDYREGKGVFNGDTGIVEQVRRDSGELIVRFDDGRRATYAGEDRLQLMPAYAITVHKSQGSEYEGVVIPLAGGNPVIMTRNLLYTAVTRARNLVVIVGTEDAVGRMVRNNYIRKRFSMLATFIRDTARKMDMLYGGENNEKSV